MSQAKFLDRLTKQVMPELGATKLAGRVILASDDPLTVNGVLLKPGDYILPGPHDRILFQPASGEETTKEGMPFHQFPDRQERHSLMTIGRRLRDLEDR